MLEAFCAEIHLNSYVIVCKINVDTYHQEFIIYYELLISYVSMLGYAF